ncbi:GNAT family N-acetyltransferase [Labilibaculum sp.]|uniref:GNAT family N-acetyltransferase n=1 Tax=Labilibaculum sp. TaxID=2060723 RepID=UPI00356326D2
MISNSYSFVEMNLCDEEHRAALFELMNAYMLDPMGCSKAISLKSFPALVEGLKNQTNYVGVLVKNQERCIALANCFVNFSTFKMRSLLNIHDFIVMPDERGKGVGRFLMQSVKQIAKNRNCCKITLEVRCDNEVAQTLYLSEDFRDCKPAMFFLEFAF